MAYIVLDIPVKVTEKATLSSQSLNFVPDWTVRPVKYDESICRSCFLILAAVTFHISVPSTGCVKPGGGQWKLLKNSLFLVF